VCCGRRVEHSDVHRLYSNPAHPYTVGLIDSIPRLDQHGDKLFAIGGLPPSLTDLPTGCSFHPRCRFATDECRVGAAPEFHEVAPGRLSACHHTEEVLHERA